MGYVADLPDGRFRARWRDPDGRLRSKSFDRKLDARQHLRNQEVAIQRGVYIDERSGGVAALVAATG